MLERLLEIGKRVLAETDVDRVLTVALDGVVELCGAERGMILLFGEDSEPLFEEARNLARQDIERPEFEVSRSILGKVRSEGTPFWSPNVLADPSFGSRRSVLRLQILSVICLPIRHGGRIFGLVYLDNRSAMGVFTPETCALVASFAELISLAAHSALERRSLRGRVEELSRELRERYQFDSILGQDPKILEVLRLVAQVAESDVTVLVLGESGTGKELVARALHYNSRRRERPFVAVNCGALPETLLDSELFGHVRGAFTGAVADSPGWFERAAGGTIFLD
ncbi:MAG TPA: sigma 54-interacting transcriptional regulator, partial [Thermoanaerobaculia bacterium]|nr:sigma 54-interacting transcriptional regulator [Thermoanaerobaculia bacterium]